MAVPTKVGANQVLSQSSIAINWYYTNGSHQIFSNKFENTQESASNSNSHRLNHADVEESPDRMQ